MPTMKMQRRQSAFPMFPFARELDQLQANVRRMFENPLAGPSFLSALPQPLAWTPPVEISESRNEMMLTMELPGMEMKDVHVSVDGDVLTVRGEKGEERTEEEEKQYYLVERSYGAFERSFTLNSTIDIAKINAEFDKGVLTVHLPKSETAIARGREIPIGKKWGARLEGFGCRRAAGDAAPRGPGGSSTPYPLPPTPSFTP